jgi:hypothetical protein
LLDEPHPDDKQIKPQNSASGIAACLKSLFIFASRCRLNRSPPRLCKPMSLAPEVLHKAGAFRCWGIFLLLLLLRTVVGVFRRMDRIELRRNTRTERDVKKDDQRDKLCGRNAGAPR